MNDINDIIYRYFMDGPNGVDFGRVILRTGRVVRILSIACYRTYEFSGIITGEPSEADNRLAMDRIRRFCCYSGFNVGQYFKIPKGVGGSTRLPDFFVVLDLESDSVDDDNMFSSLRFVKFVEQLDFKQLTSDVGVWLDNLDWNKYAKSWKP